MSVPRIAPRHWVYLDDARTHEVHAEVEAAPDEDRLVTTEFPAGSRDPTEAIQVARRVTAEAEVSLLIRDLEERLRLSGTYFRADAADMRWTPLGSPGGRVDLRSVELRIPGGPEDARISFHHFHAEGGQDRMLIHMPRLDLDLSKHVLAELAFRFPAVEAGDLQLLHARLTPATLRTSLVQRHLELPRMGYGKLVDPTDYQRAYGEEWQETAKTVFGRAASRMLRAQDGPLVVHGGGAEHPRLAEIRVALRSTRVATLKGRFLEPGEAAAALGGGEHAVRRLVNAKRRQLPHTAAYELSVLEAALLLEFADRARVASLIEEEGEKLMRFVHGYR
ncbi:MAG TPA: hypothetical protein VHH36_04975 [Candidatus Thermoplasmatota archaeon]|nr:hypothetical protein [Candidatus Thermoplasmatota archaeon]